MSTREFVQALVRQVRSEYRTDEFIPLHAPLIGRREREVVMETLETGFVSSVGRHVGDFEQAVADYTGSPYAVATVNGTAALHMCLILAGVEANDEVITQSITFVATCNAIRYCKAVPVLVDIDRSTLGMCPDALAAWLEDNAELADDGSCRNRQTGRRIRACVPMHNFGHPVRIERLAEVCERWGLVMIEDAAESLGSFYRGRHTGRFCRLAAISFNGNKIITTGGGGMILTDDEAVARRAKHLTTTAKQPHPWLYIHDETGYNYRLPALNAALGCAQMERLLSFVERKRELAGRYAEWFQATDYPFVHEPEGARSNYWFNAFLCRDRAERDQVLEQTNQAGVMTRPVWTPMHTLNLFQDCPTGPMPNADWLNDRLVNIPSSVPPERDD
ncbi:MAG: LegC family aminotransferase [Wenzhouxiangella sp.]|nr:LegC family aminotransferase [Wenzhouxiangella sp.]